MSDGFSPTGFPAAHETIGNHPPRGPVGLDQSGPSPLLPAPKPSGGAGLIWRKVVAGIGVVGLVGGGAFAVRSFASPESNTPTQAVQQFITAVNSTDIISAMEALAPGERNLLIDTGVPMVNELTRLDVFAKGTDLRKVDGASLKFSDQTYTETIIRDDIATVTMKGGNLAIAADVSKLFGGVITQFAEETLPGKTNETQKFDSANLATIKRGGRWYVSLSYSIAEAARKDLGKPMPEKSASIAAIGADSPEAAVSQMMNKLGGLDAKGAIALMDPDEMGALQDYSPLFIQDLEKAATEGKQQFSLTFPDLGLKATKNGSSTTVAITKWSADLTIPSTEGKGTRVQLDGDCVTAEVEDEKSKRCGKELPKLVNDLIGDKEAPVDPEIQKAWDQSYGKWVTTPGEQGGISVVERNGKWFVAPVRTMMDSVVTSLKKVKPEDLKGTGNTPEERFTSLLDNPLFGSALGATPFGGLLGEGNSLSDPLSAEDVPLDPSFESDFDSDFDSGLTDSESGGAATDAADAANEFIGDIPSDSVPLDSEPLDSEPLDSEPLSPEVQAELDRIMKEIELENPDIGLGITDTLPA
jgi:hypothetical protein